MFTLAHLSDVHLSPLPKVTLGELMSKRAIGFLSWHLKRKKVHLNTVCQLILEDIARYNPAHIALTGDVINLAAEREFDAATKWIKALAQPSLMSFVPGNHDTYVHVPWDKGLGRWQDYMTGDLKVPKLPGAGRFPYVRQRRNIALIGVSSAIPAPLTKAIGQVGNAQLEALAAILRHLHGQGFYRVVMIHHPPLPGQAPGRKALRDTGPMKSVLETEGAELVLHGHNHVHMRTDLQSRTGPVHVIGIPSASACGAGHSPAAAWYMHKIERKDGRWTNTVEVRSYDDAKGHIVSTDVFRLESG